MDKEQIKETIEYFKGKDVSIRVRDIAYVMLSKIFSDGTLAYQCLFDANQDGYEEYSADDSREQLENYLREKGFLKSVSDDDNVEGITFEENKQAMEKMLVDIQKDMEDGVIEKKDGYARMTDIRTKLNDKFKIERQNKERMIVVEKKFDFVCPHTRRECYQLDKEYAMQKFNLIEKTTEE